MSGVNSPSISVIMSVYNGEKYIARALLSILAQTFADFEIIVIDDGSSDNTSDIINSIRDNRIIFIKQKNIGLTKSLNKALSLARGKWIARQDADDFSISTRFEQQLLFLKKKSDVGLLGSSCFIQPESHSIVNEIYMYPEKHAETVTAFTEYNPFVHGSMIIDKDLLISNGGYNECYRYVQDYELWSRLISKTRVHNICIPLYVRSVHKESSQLVINKEPIFNEIRSNYLKYYNQTTPTNGLQCRLIQSISIYPIITLKKSWNKILSDSFYRMSLESKKHRLPWLNMRMQSAMYYPWSFGMAG